MFPSVQIDLPPTMVITKGLPGKYTAVQMHLHWGGWDLEASGAEHTIDGIRYMAEVGLEKTEFIKFKSQVCPDEGRVESNCNTSWCTTAVMTTRNASILFILKPVVKQTCATIKCSSEHELQLSTHTAFVPHTASVHSHSV